MFLICVIHELYVKKKMDMAIVFFLNASTFGFSPLYCVCGAWSSLL